MKQFGRFRGLGGSGNDLPRRLPSTPDDVRQALIDLPLVDLLFTGRTPARHNGIRSKEILEAHFGLDIQKQRMLDDASPITAAPALCRFFVLRYRSLPYDPGESHQSCPAR